MSFWIKLKFVTVPILLVCIGARAVESQKNQDLAKTIYLEGTGDFKIQNGPKLKIPNLIKFTISKNQEVIEVENYSIDLLDPQRRYYLRKSKFMKGPDGDWTVETQNPEDEIVSYTAHVKLERDKIKSMKRSSTYEGLTEIEEITPSGPSSFLFSGVGIGKQEKRKFSYKLMALPIKASAFESKLKKSGILVLSKDEKVKRIREFMNRK